MPKIPKTSRRYEKLFRDKAVLRNMTLDWDEGMNILQLSKKYHCDRASIYYELKLLNKWVKKVVPSERDRKEVFHNPYQYLLDEGINSGKEYKDYLKK